MKLLLSLKMIFVDLFFWFLKVCPTSLGGKFRYLVYKKLFKSAGKFHISENVTIVGFHNISLGNNVSIGESGYLISPDGGEISIGDNCTFNTNVMINATPGSIQIGNEVAIGPNTVVRASDHTFGRIDVPIRDQEQIFGTIKMHGDNWIASNCVITSNVELGKGAIVAAGAIVTKNVDELTMVGGVPAKVLRKREQINDVSKVKLKKR